MANKKISELTAYTTPLDADLLAVVDTANAITKKTTWANIKATLKTYFDTQYPAETTTTIGALINGATGKTTPIDADYLGLMDSAASNILKKLSWANVKATLKTYFDTLYLALAGGTLTGNITFGENTELILDAALSADGKYCGITEDGTLGETVAFGEVVYLKAADSQWYLTDADADATAGAVKVGICVLAGVDNGATKILLYGKIRADAKFPALTIAAPVYISTTAGAVQTAQPSGTDDVIRIIGYGNTADELFFNPSNDYITHT